MKKPDTYWEGNVLMHRWYGSDTADEIGILRENKDLRKVQALVFEADTNDDLFIRYYYSKPSAEEVFAAFSNWQRG